jgi:hypothetical protein
VKGSDENLKNMVKKFFIIIAALALFTLIPLVYASNDAVYTINFGSTSSISHVLMAMSFGNTVQIVGVGIAPGVDYTLVYTSDKMPLPSICDRRTPGCQIRPGPSTYSSKRFPKAKCILQGIAADKNGVVGRIATYNYKSIVEDKKLQTLVLVKSSDVNCKTGTMKKWNPSEYFFGDNTI